MTHDKVLMSIKVVPNNTAYTFTSPTCTKKEKKKWQKNIYNKKKSYWNSKLLNWMSSPNPYNFFIKPIKPLFPFLSMLLFFFYLIFFNTSYKIELLYFTMFSIGIALHWKKKKTFLSYHHVD